MRIGTHGTTTIAHGDDGADTYQQRIPLSDVKQCRWRCSQLAAPEGRGGRPLHRW